MSDPAKAVFLSYASQDAEAAKRICDALRAAGVEVWFDQSELVGGDAWDAKIRGQIAHCALFVPIISACTQARLEGYFRLEWKLAVQRMHTMAEEKAFLFPIVIDDTRDAEAKVPVEFKTVQWTRLPGGEGAGKFCARVAVLLGGPVAADRGLPIPAAKVEAGPAGESARPVRRPSTLVLSALALAITGTLGLALFVFRQPERPVVAPPPAPEKPAPAVAAKPADKSIAVLPFTNMSEDQGGSFFADGMHEDILTNLAVIRDLRVTSRTSVMEYRGTTKKIRQIGAELGVAYVLEGSVRRAGNKVRVTGQLINVATDEHVWAKSYDRDLTDIFAIQSELSQAIAKALSAVLSPQEKSLVESRPTANLAAYDLFLKARAWEEAIGGGTTRAQAESWLREAVNLDPNFAQAWALLGVMHSFAYGGNEDRTPQRLALAKAATETAVRLAPDDPVVIQQQGNFYYRALGDYAQAAVHYRRVLAINPSSADAYLYLGFLERRQGRWTEGLAFLQKAAQLDPRGAFIVWEIGDTLRDLRRYDEALASFQRSAELAPANLFLAYEVHRVAFYARGSTRELEAWEAGIKPAPSDAKVALAMRRDMLRLRGDWAKLVEFHREHASIEWDEEFRWEQEVDAVADLAGTGDLAAVRARAKMLLPELTLLTETQPTNAAAWRDRARLHAFADEREQALRCARRMRELMPESYDAKVGPSYSCVYASVLAWTGDKDGALAELARLLQTPRGANVHFLRLSEGFLPLRGDPRFEALLNDPKNNAPLF